MAWLTKQSDVPRRQISAVLRRKLENRELLPFWRVAFKNCPATFRLLYLFLGATVAGRKMNLDTRINYRPGQSASSFSPGLGARWGQHTLER